jgi:hypothetical protein
MSGMGTEKKFKTGQVIVIDERAALITRVGGDDGKSASIDYSFIESDGNLGHGHHFKDWEAEKRGIKFIDFAKVRTVVDLPPEWREQAHAYETRTDAAAIERREVLGEWEPETHPSYGFVQVSRVSGHNALFASPFKHQHFMTLTIGRSTRQRSLGRDWHFGGLTHGLVEIALSEAQWAHMVSSVGMGGGVPCTLRYVGGARMEDCPEQADVERFHDDIERDAKAAMKFMNAALAKMQALADDKAPTKEKRKEVLAELQRAQKAMTDSAPFMVKQLHEHMDKVVHAAKTEVEAYVHSTIVEAGIQKLAEVNGKPPPLTFEVKTKTEPKLVEGETKKDGKS